MSFPRKKNIKNDLIESELGEFCETGSVSLISLSAFLRQLLQGIEKEHCRRLKSNCVRLAPNQNKKKQTEHSEIFFYPPEQR